MKNFHLPLPEHTYAGLRAEAERAGVPATTLAREAVDWWLRQQFRKGKVRCDRSAFAKEKAGTDYVDTGWSGTQAPEGVGSKCVY